MEKKDITEIREVKTNSANAFRGEIDKDSIIVEFGKLLRNGNETEVDVVSSVSFSPNLLNVFIMQLLKMGIKYEEKYNCDIGIKSQLIAADYEGDE